jgi:predicted cupin superfamily sugar epimerase
VTKQTEPGAEARAVIERLELVPHPEGGWYRETFRSEIILPQAALPAGYPGERRTLTSILFLLPTDARSAWHRVRGEELWIHQAGDELRLAYRAALEDTSVHTLRLGMAEGAVPQALVPARWWQAATALPGGHGYALVACVVAPGFEFEDFEIAPPNSGP